jgi:hypothetical protein
MTTEFPETFDPSQEEGNTWSLIPPGEYVAQMIEAEVSPTKKGDGTVLRLVWKILEGDYENRQVWDYVTYRHPSEQAQSIGRKKIKDMCVAMDIQEAVQDAAVFLYKPAKIRVAIERDKDGVYEDKNKVTRVLPLEPKANSGPPPVPATSAPKPVPAAPAVAAGPAKTAPWHTSAAR